MAGEASAKFSILLGDLAAFDCRISQLPRVEDVVDYFRWRSEDAYRNALNAHCNWMLREHGESASEAASHLERLSVADKNEILFSNGVNFNDLPNWQKRGIGLFWESYSKEGVNALTGEAVTTVRRRVQVELDLPMKEQYGEFIREIVDRSRSGN